MNLANRRSAMKLVVGGALLPIIASYPAVARSLTQDRALPQNLAITPPEGKMIYRRIIQRQLPGGAQLEVARAFVVYFDDLGSGYRIRGDQSAAHVVAPDHLASLAQLEEQRVETGIFPLMLDANGQIVDGEGDPSLVQFEAALSHVQSRFEHRNDEAGDLIEALHSASTQLTAVMPRDLFAPTQEMREQSRIITLPWGDRGEVRTHFEAKRDPQTHLMCEAQREVVTTLGNDQRRSAENWILQRA